MEFWDYKEPLELESFFLLLTIIGTVTLSICCSVIGVGIDHLFVLILVVVNCINVAWAMGVFHFDINR